MSEYLQASEHFSKNELQCKCGHPNCKGRGMNADFMNDLETLRVQYGKGMIINSAERCVKHCIEAKKIKKGRLPGAHAKGAAVDVRVTDSGDRYRILQLALALGFEGIAVGKNFLHLDKYANLDGRGENPCRTWVY